jgi:nucleoside-diphosphate-sugar epimerase
MRAPFWRDKTVLVTGGTGMIGAHVAKRLLEAGARVTVATRTGRSAIWDDLLAHAPIDRRQGDLRDAAFARACTAGQEVVFHSRLADRRTGIQSMPCGRDDDLQCHTRPAGARCRSQQRVGSFFYPSGALVYDEAAVAPVGERASTSGAPLWACRGAAWAKRAVETAIGFMTEQVGMSAVIARFANIYGPGDDFGTERAHLLGNLIRCIVHDERPEIWGDGTQLRSFLYVDDAVEAALRVVECAPGSHPINIGGQTEYAVRDIVSMLLDISGKPLHPLFHSDRPVGLKRKLLDNTKLRDLTAFEESTSLRTGLETTYHWYVSQCRRTVR